MLQPLRLVISKTAAVDGVVANIECNTRRGLREFQPAFCAHDGTFVIVGSGPSLAGFADAIRGEKAKGRPICAIKGAHDWLCNQGIEPDLFFSIDPRDRRNNVQCKTENTVYMLASRCDPIMFDHLKSRKEVVLVHTLSSDEENQWYINKGKYLVGGMSTSGLRAFNMAYMWGFRNFVMYGMDSCNAPDGVTKRIDGSLTGQTTDVIIGKTGRKFICNIAMAKQAEDFQKLYQMMPDIHVESHGDGLLTAILEERKAKGFRT